MPAKYIVMLAKNHRFIGLGSLRYVYRRGQTVRGSWFALKTVRNERRETYRAAVVVSRKVAKSAVVRNKIRRRLFETLRRLEGEITEPYDIVITVFSSSILEESPNALTKALHKQLAAAGAIKARPIK